MTSGYHWRKSLGYHSTKTRDLSVEAHPRAGVDRGSSTQPSRDTLPTPPVNARLRFKSAPQRWLSIGPDLVNKTFVTKVVVSFINLMLGKGLGLLVVYLLLPGSKRFSMRSNQSKIIEAESPEPNGPASKSWSSALALPLSLLPDDPLLNHHRCDKPNLPSHRRPAEVNCELTRSHYLDRLHSWYSEVGLISVTGAQYSYLSSVLATTPIAFRVIARPNAPVLRPVAKRPPAGNQFPGIRVLSLFHRRSLASRTRQILQYMSKVLIPQGDHLPFTWGY
ncbi:hypothetical protein BD779DRAFT_1474960 [Infundibulicybe gibba]|nr:hypothetical protein BD779DRAFT_1474960 [Infundibulicybe gibba]